MKIISKMIFLLGLTLFIFSIFASATLQCDILRSNSYGWSKVKSNSGYVKFCTGKELDGYEWWAFWEDNDDKTIYAIFYIGDERYCVKTEMRLSTYYGKKFNNFYFDRINLTNTEGYDEDEHLWKIQWDLINPF